VTVSPLALDLWQTLRSRWRLMLAVLPGLALTMLHSTALDLPRAEIVEALNSDRYRVQWIAGSYLVGSATGMALTGFFGSRLGLRGAFFLALGLFTTAGSACGIVSDVFWMAPLRLVEGFGTGLLIATGMVMLWRAFPARRGLAMALYGMAVYVPALAGAPLGGLLADRATWRLIFLLNLPAGAIVGCVAWLLLPAEREVGAAPKRMDWIGLALLVGWIVPLNVVLDYGQYWGWFASPVIVPWFVALLVAFAAFVSWGIWRAQPLISLRVLAIPHFSLGLGIKVLFSVNLYALVSLFAGYMIQLRAYQWWQGALVLSAGMATMLGGVVFGVAVGNDGNRRLRMIGGLALMALADYLLAGVDVFTDKGWQAWRLALWGFGAGLVAGPSLLTTFEGLSDEQILPTAGIFNVCRSLPAFLVGGLLATYLTRRTDAHFDYLRQTVTYNQPAVVETLRGAEQHFMRQGYAAPSAGKQAHATLAQWTHANARAAALRDVLLLLALAPGVAILLTLIVRIPASTDLHEHVAT
jgi:MFS transporter, DHA2 family, multidrug resistance protein